MQQSFMKTRPVLPLVLSMSLPMVLSMMVSSLYNIVDSYYVAKISEDAMTALSLVYPGAEFDQRRDHRLFHRRQRGDRLSPWGPRTPRRPTPPRLRAFCGTFCTGSS